MRKGTMYQIKYDGAMKGLTARGPLMAVSDGEVTIGVGAGNVCRVPLKDVVSIYEVTRVSPSLTLLRSVHV